MMQDLFSDTWIAIIVLFTVMGIISSFAVTKLFTIKELLKTSKKSKADFLDLNRLQSGKFGINCTETNIKDIIENISVIYKKICEEHKIELILKTTDSVPRKVIIDEIRIKQIIFNLLSNSIKFTPTGGTIFLTFDYVRNELRFIFGLALLAELTLINAQKHYSLLLNCITVASALHILFELGFICLFLSTYFGIEMMLLRWAIYIYSVLQIILFTTLKTNLQFTFTVFVAGFTDITVFVLLLLNYYAGNLGYLFGDIFLILGCACHAYAFITELAFIAEGF